MPFGYTFNTDTNLIFKNQFDVDELAFKDRYPSIQRLRCLIQSLDILFQSLDVVF